MAETPAVSSPNLSRAACTCLLHLQHGGKAPPWWDWVALFKLSPEWLLSGRIDVLHSTEQGQAPVALMVSVDIRNRWEWGIYQGLGQCSSEKVQTRLAGSPETKAAPECNPTWAGVAHLWHPSHPGSYSQSSPRKTGAACHELSGRGRGHHWQLASSLLPSRVSGGGSDWAPRGCRGWLGAWLHALLTLQFRLFREAPVWSVAGHCSRVKRMPQRASH